MNDRLSDEQVHDCAFTYDKASRLLPALVMDLAREVQESRTRIAALEAAIDAIREHHRHFAITGIGINCYNGNCDHDDECPELEFIVCSAAMAVIEDINDEIVPDAALVENCPTCRALDALKEARG